MTVFFLIILWVDLVNYLDWTRLHSGFPGGLVGKESVCNAGHPGSVPGSGRSLGEGNGNPLQYSCLENSMDRGAWWAIVHGVTESWTWLSDKHFHFQLGWGQVA